ncbi:alpha/beta hydrolase [Ramlibacter sp. AN1015]|uniref:alpha/beta hydrolase n=1 Tax=Ramlibacter sp. AN1015 TaxID=3133428 RepID=UPI0030C088A9
MSEMPPEDLGRVRAALDALGPRYAEDIARHSQLVKELYAPLLAAQPRAGIDITRDISYGEHPRQVLDVYRPMTATQADVMVFVHGGAFVRGAKSGPEGLYDNVPLWFARRGFIGVNVEYRLAPEAPYPQGALDLAAALEWVHRNAATCGGDPGRILLVGHSAGGTHAAAYACDPMLAQQPCRARALVLVSGRLRADVSPRNPNAPGVRAYFGEDTGCYEARSPVTHAHRCAIPAMVALAQYENPLLDVYGLEFAHRLSVQAGTAPRVLQCMGHNHMSIVAHLGSGEDTLGDAIRDFWSSV